MSQNLYVKTASSGGWKTANKVYVKIASTGPWKQVNKAWVKVTSTLWKEFLGNGIAPTVDNAVTVTKGSWSIINGLGQFTLVGTNGIWSTTEGTVLNQIYYFQSSSDGVTWTTFKTGSITNSDVKTAQATEDLYKAATMKFRFVVEAIGSNGSNGSSESNELSALIPAPLNMAYMGVSAVANTGGGAPTVDVNVGGGQNEFTITLSNPVSASRAVIAWSGTPSFPTGTTPTSPQEYLNLSSVNTISAVVSQTTTVNVTGTVYGYIGVGGTISAGWGRSNYANKYKVFYSLNGAAEQMIETDQTDYDFGSFNNYDSMYVRVLPYNTYTGLEASPRNDTQAIGAPAYPNPTTFSGYTATVVNSETVAPYAITNPVATRSGSDVVVTSGTWGPEAYPPTGYVYVMSSDIINDQPVRYPSTPGTTTTDTSHTFNASSSREYSVKVTAYNAYGSGDAYSNGVDAVTIPVPPHFPAVPPHFPPAAAPTKISAPVLDTIGTTFYSTAGSWNNSPTLYTYNWYRNDTNSIIKTTSDSSSTVDTYVGSTSANYGVYTIVTAANTIGSATSDPSNAINIFESAPVNTVLPHISNVGTTITGTAGTWDYSPTSYTYRWYRDDIAPNSNGNPLKTTSNTTNTSDTYVGSASNNYGVYFTVTATNGVGSTEAYSDGTVELYVAVPPHFPPVPPHFPPVPPHFPPVPPHFPPVPPHFPPVVAPTNASAPSISNVGTLVTCTAGTWDNNPTSYTYRWYRDDLGPSSAGNPLKTTSNTTSTSDTYTGSTSNNYGIYVAVTATNSAGSNVAYSGTVELYVAAPPHFPPVPPHFPPVPPHFPPVPPHFPPVPPHFPPVPPHFPPATVERLCTSSQVSQKLTNCYACTGCCDSTGAGAIC